MKRESVTQIVKQEQQNSILSQIHKIIGPFLLRRKKSEVDVTILPKKEVIVYCPMTEMQTQQYSTFIRQVKTTKAWAAKNLNGMGQNDMMRGYHMQFMMDLRNAVNHPYVGAGPPPDDTPESDIIDCCGKMQVGAEFISKINGNQWG